MKVYRVELRMSSIKPLEINGGTRTNIGPYYGSFFMLPFANKCGYNEFRHGQYAQGDNCPTLDEENITLEDHQESWLFGFLNLEQYYRWFTDFSMRMHKAGFIMAVYEVPESAMLVTPNQIVFDIKQSNLIEYIELDSLHNKKLNENSTCINDLLVL